MHFSVKKPENVTYITISSDANFTEWDSRYMSTERATAYLLSVSKAFSCSLKQHPQRPRLRSAVIRQNGRALGLPRTAQHFSKLNPVKPQLHNQFHSIIKDQSSFKKWMQKRKVKCLNVCFFSMYTNRIVLPFVGLWFWSINPFKSPFVEVTPTWTKHFWSLKIR